MTSYAPGVTPQAGYFPGNGAGIGAMVGGGLPAFSRDENQRLLDQVFGAGKVVAGQGGGEAALATATPEQQMAYQQARNQYAGQEAYKPQYVGGVAPVGMLEPLNDWQKQALTTASGGFKNTGYLDMLSGYLGNADQMLQGASQYMQPMGNDQFSQGIERYMNPYQQQVVDSTTAQMSRQGSIDQNNLNALFNQGSFGSSSHRIGAQEMASDLQRNIGDVAGNLNYQGYNQAVGNTLNQYNTDQNRGLTGTLQAASLYPQLGQSALAGQDATYGMYSNNLNSLMNAGNTVQGQNQRMLDLLNPMIQGVTNWPQDSITQTANNVNANFNGSQNYNYTSQPNMASKVGGLGLMGLGGVGANGDWALSNYYPTVQGTPWKG